MTPLCRFEIHQPSSAAEASLMLTEFGDEAGVYAGGTELLLAMRHGALRYRHLVDVKTFLPFNSIEQRDGAIEIGAGTTHRAIERSALVREKQAVLAEMESRVANVRVRASGTLGGNLCFAEPHSDPATLLLALGATVRTESASGTREMRIGELIEGAYTNSLQPGELLTAVRVPCAPEGQRAAYLKFQVHERPTLGLALVMDTSDGGAVIDETRVAVGCVCPFPRRSQAAEEMLTGARDEVESRIGQAAEALAADAELIDDNEGGADYKQHLIEVFLRRAFLSAFAESKS